MRRSREALLVLAVVVLAVAAIAGFGSAPTRSTSLSPSGPAATVPNDVSLPRISRSDLPPEARTTLERIAAGGPYPFRADGSVFENRERLLPARPPGTYREYTVATPGSADRGARRIVAASGGEVYWTDDHYASFSRIVP